MQGRERHGPIVAGPMIPALRGKAWRRRSNRPGCCSSRGWRITRPAACTLAEQKFAGALALAPGRPSVLDQPGRRAPEARSARRRARGAGRGHRAGAGQRRGAGALRHRTGRTRSHRGGAARSSIAPWPSMPRPAGAVDAARHCIEGAGPPGRSGRFVSRSAGTRRRRGTAAVLPGRPRGRRCAATAAAPVRRAPVRCLCGRFRPAPGAGAALRRARCADRSASRSRAAGSRMRSTWVAAPACAGRLLRPLADRVVGVDLSAQMLREGGGAARLRRTASQADVAEFLAASGERPTWWSRPTCSSMSARWTKCSHRSRGACPRAACSASPWKRARRRNWCCAPACATRIRRRGSGDSRRRMDFALRRSSAAGARGSAAADRRVVLLAGSL